MKVVDSSLWVEWFTDGTLATVAERLLEDPREVLVPWIVLLEVYKFALRTSGPGVANQLVARMMLSPLSFPDVNIALQAGKLCVEEGLATADATVLAHAREAGLVLATSDRHFDGIPGVEYHPKSAST